MADYEIYPEVRAAARWWADQLSTHDVPQDNGDATQSAVATFCRDAVAKLNTEERAVFERALQSELQVYVVRGDFKRARTEPNWGSASRVITVDYGPDGVLAAAAHVVTGENRQQQARVSLLWPIKTAMWINPGDVRVRHGYGAEITIIYPRPAGEEPTK